MGDYIKAILDALKSPRLVLPVALSAWFLALAKPGLMLSLGLTDFRSTYHAAITLTAIVSTAVLLGQLIGMGYDRAASGISRSSKAKTDAQQHNATISGLTFEEKRYLTFYFLKYKDCLMFPQRDGVIEGLVRQNIVFRSSSSKMLGEEYVGVNLEPWARKTVEQMLEKMDPAFNVPGMFDHGRIPYAADSDGSPL
jgi:hypothetical protein